MKEIWKDIPGFEGYQVSNFGQIKSLSRVILKNGKYPCLTKERILKPKIKKIGYKEVNLSIGGKDYMRSVHQLVAIGFLNHIPCKYELVVNHIDFNKLNNNVNNLEIITQRQNSCHRAKQGSSNYIGVSHNHRSNKKWRAHIYLDKKRIYLGSFYDEKDAAKAYQEALKKYEKETLNFNKLKELV